LLQRSIVKSPKAIALIQKAGGQAGFYSHIDSANIMDAFTKGDIVQVRFFEYLFSIQFWKQFDDFKWKKSHDVTLDKL